MRAGRLIYWSAMALLASRGACAGTPAIEGQHVAVFGELDRAYTACLSHARELAPGGLVFDRDFSACGDVADLHARLMAEMKAEQRPKDLALVKRALEDAKRAGLQ